MPDGREKQCENNNYWWSINSGCYTAVYGEEMWDYLQEVALDAYPDHIVIRLSSRGDKKEAEKLEKEEEFDEDESEKKMNNSI